MSERPKFRGVQEVTARRKHINGEIEAPRSYSLYPTVLSGPNYPSLDQLEQNAVNQSQVSHGAALGYDHDFYSYQPGELRIERLRSGRISNALSRIGLDRFVSYETVRTFPNPHAYLAGTESEVA